MDKKTWEGDKSGREELPTSSVKSRASELSGLIENGTFKVINHDDVADGSRHFGSRFVYTITYTNSGARPNSCLVTLKYGYEEVARKSTIEPAALRSSQRLLLFFAALVKGMSAYIREVSLAYILSTASLKRNVYIYTPSALKLPGKKLLKVVKPWYGISESGLYCYLMYAEYDVQKLGMQQSRLDFCSLYKLEGSFLTAMDVQQVDDSLAVAVQLYHDQKEQESKSFTTRSRQPLHQVPISFNGINISFNCDQLIHIMQENKIKSLYVQTEDNEFSSHRVLAQYIRVNWKLELCAAVQLIAHSANKVRKADYRSLRRIIVYLKIIKKQILAFVRFNMETVTDVLI